MPPPSTMKASAVVRSLVNSTINIIDKRDMIEFINIVSLHHPNATSTSSTNLKGKSMNNTMNSLNLLNNSINKSFVYNKSKDSNNNSLIKRYLNEFDIQLMIDDALQVLHSIQNVSGL